MNRTQLTSLALLRNWLCMLVLSPLRAGLRGIYKFSDLLSYNQGLLKVNCLPISSGIGLKMAISNCLDEIQSTQVHILQDQWLAGDYPEGQLCALLRLVLIQ